MDDYLEGVKHLFRFHHRDARDLLEIIVWIAGLALLGALVGFGLDHLIPTQVFTACGQIGCRHTHGTLPPYRGPGPTLPPFKP